MFISQVQVHALFRLARICPLAGVRIVDLTAVIFGPLATQTLAGYGAGVIKIEPPEGDSTRFTGPDKERGSCAGRTALRAWVLRSPGVAHASNAVRSYSI